MVNPLDTTLEALQNIQDAADELKARKNITKEETLQDYDRIIKHLEESASSLLNAVVIFQKHEKTYQMTRLFQNSCSFYIDKMLFRWNGLRPLLARFLDNSV